MNVFSHSGDLGDVIYSLPVIRALGGGDLVLTAGTTAKVREPMTAEKAAALMPLLTAQPYVGHVSFAPAGRPDRVTYNLDDFRTRKRRFGYQELLVDWALRTWDLPTSHRDKPWLTSPMFIGRDRSYPAAVFSRTTRWRNNEFPWPAVVAAACEAAVRCGFVGTAEEHEDFCRLAGDVYVELLPTPNFLEIAHFVSRSRLFVGNQSAPLAVALGLGKTCVIEAYPGHEDCSLPRPNVIAFPPNTNPAKLVADLLGSTEWTPSPSSS